jgi:hypothetical protein
MSEMQETYHALTSPLARQAPRWDFGAVWSARTAALFGPEDENAPRAVNGSTERTHDGGECTLALHCSTKEEVKWNR